MKIRAAPANVAATYAALGPIARKNYLMKVGGLTNPQERQRSKAARRQLSRLVERDQAEKSG